MDNLNKDLFWIYHWDTIESRSMLLHKTENFHEAVSYINKKYHKRFTHYGRARVDIVHGKTILRNWRVR